MKSTDERARKLFELETSLHTRQIRSSREAASQLLADEFIEFGSSGRVFDKPAIIASMINETSYPQIAVDEFATRDLARDVVLVTYIASRPETLAEGRPVRSLRSSIWKLFGDRWQMVFHQGTRA
jgi:hypothetical protein